ncbi:MAG TPA: hypothetical protein VF746_10610 [Longimicrobium sp.]
MPLLDVRIRATRAGVVRLLGLLLAVELAFFFFYGAIRVTDRAIDWGALYALFDLDAEQSVPAWFSSLQLFAAGAVFLVGAREGRTSRPALSRLLFLLGLGFLFLSLDEAASLHERFDAAGRGAWLAAYALIAAAALPVFLYFTLPGLRELLYRHRRESLWLAAGVVTMFAGGVAIELVGHLFLHGAATPAFRAIEVGVEELFEMAGCTLVLCGALLLAGPAADADGDAAGDS